MTKPVAPEKNQCDGCALGLPVDENGNHLREGAVFGIHQSCTKHKYGKPAPEPSCKAEPPPYHEFEPDSKEPLHCAVCWQYKPFYLHKSSSKLTAPALPEIAPAATAERELPYIYAIKDWGDDHCGFCLASDVREALTQALSTIRGLETRVEFMAKDELAAINAKLDAQEEAGRALSDLTRAQEQIASLSNSDLVHSNILTGQIALTKAQAIHIAGLPADIEQQIAALQGRIEEVEQRLEHYEDSPWTSSTMLEQIENKKYATYTDEEFELFFEYSVDCKCSFCAFIRYVIELRKLTAPIAPEKGQD